MLRLILGVTVLVAGTILVIVVAWMGLFKMPHPVGRFIFLWGAMAGLAFAVLVSVTVAVVQRSYAAARGARNRETGLPCTACGRTAFPVEGTSKLYRCWTCGCRFDGPRHFD